MRVGVILDGGWGERLWPLSRPLHPKQIVPLGDSGSLLENAVRDITPLIPLEHLYIITNQQLQPILQAQLPDMPAQNILAEPCRRNSSGGLAYALASLQTRYGNDFAGATLAVLTSDHVIGNAEGFRETVSAAMELAEQEQKLVCMGIRLTRPETGFGYIELGEERGIVARFVEKPDADRAHRMVDSGRSLWNSGMLFGTVATFIAELRGKAPHIAEAIDAMRQGMADEDVAVVERAFERLKDTSIDYALLERCEDLRVVEGDFGWDNLNAWDTFARISEADAAGNMTFGDTILIDDEDCLVYNAMPDDTMTVAALGLSNMAIIVTPDAILVMPMDRAQDVRRVVEKHEQRKPWTPRTI